MAIASGLLTLVFSMGWLAACLFAAGMFSLFPAEGASLPRSTSIPERVQSAMMPSWPGGCGNVFVSITGALLWMLAELSGLLTKYHSYAAMAVAEEMPFGGIECRGLSTGTVTNIMKHSQGTLAGTGLRHASGLRLAARLRIWRSTRRRAAAERCRNPGCRTGQAARPDFAHVASWIGDRMAMHIMRRFQDEYEFWILTAKCPPAPDLVRTPDSRTRFHLSLTDKSYKLLRAAAGTMKLPPSIFWLHH